jgi:hypothetical protein
MVILQRHIDFYRRIFEIPGFLADPVLTLGFQDILGRDLPEDFDRGDLKRLLRTRGLTDVTTLDLFDDRADLRYDLNLPVPEGEHERYGAVLDIGTLEHVFDTRQCLENCLRMVRTGGHYFLHTPVKGYFCHGLHTFHPEGLLRALEVNAFEIRFLAYSSLAGESLERPEEADDSLIWVVARKAAALDEFQNPQQSKWARRYSGGG